MSLFNIPVCQETQSQTRSVSWNVKTIEYIKFIPRNN